MEPSTPITKHSISRKIFLLAASFALPISVLVWLMVSSITGHIDFASQELRGNAYQRALERLLEDSQDHYLNWSTCGSAVGCTAGLEQEASAVRTAFEQLRRADGEHGVALQFTPEGLGKRDRSHLTVDQVQARWERLAATVRGGASRDGIEKAYDAWFKDVRLMVTHAGDTSNLILDPDLDSYYLMDVTLIALPQAQDRIARGTAAGHRLVTRGSLSARERTGLMVQAALLEEADLDRVTASSETSFKEDPNFYGVSSTLASLRQPLAAYQAASRRFIDLVRQVAESADRRVRAEEFAEAGRAAQGAAFAYWEEAARELDRLLQARIASYEQQRATALIWSGLALLAACFLAFLLARSITVPLQKLVGTLGPGATLLGSCIEKITEATQGKTASAADAAIICDELNAQADDMRRAVLQLAAQVEGAGAAEPVHQTSGYHV